MATVLKKGGAEEPLVSSPSSTNITRAQMLMDVSVEEINDEFQRGYITAKQRNDIMREKAHATVSHMIENQGFFGAVLQQTIQNIQKGWDNLKEAEQKAQESKGVGSTLKANGLALWGAVQVLTGVISATGTVSGHKAELMALGAGASPGLARLINISVDVGTGFFPVGKATQLGAKGFQAVRKIGSKTEEAAGAAAKVAEEAKMTEQIVEDALKQSMSVEGVGPVIAQEATKPLGPLNIREQFAEDFRRFKREMRDITEPQSHAQTAKMARSLNVTVDGLRDILPGTALNEREMYAYLKAMEPQIERAYQLAGEMATGGEAAANAFALHMSELFTFVPKFRGAEVTAGRAVEILKETPPMKKISDMLVGWDAESIAKGDFQGAIKTLATDVLASKDQPEKLMAMAIQSQSLWGQFKSGMWPKLREGYYNLLLPMSLPANAIGNAIGLATTAMEHMVGGLFSADKATGLVTSEGWMMLKGYAAAFGDGAAMASFKHAFKGIEPGELSKLDYVPHQIQTLAELPWTVRGAAGSAVNLPSDTLRGMDNFNRALLRRASYYSEAIRDGIHAGMSDAKKVINTPEYRAKFGNESLTEFVKRKVQHPSESMRNSADVLATHHTYQDQLGTMANHLRGIAQWGPNTLYFPFMKTPINLVKYAWDRTPILQGISGQLYRDIAAGGVKADEAIARITIANMQGMFIYQLAQEGYLTGSGPVDPTLRRVWMATHQPYSRKTAEGWQPYSGFEPGSTPVGLIADLAQVHNQLDNPTAQQLGMAGVFAIMRGMLDKTWWRTVSDITEVASNIQEGVSPAARLRDIALAPALTVATGGPLGAAVRRGIDPIQRETRELMDSVMSRIPGYSKDVPPVRDVYGEPVIPPQNVAGPWLGLAVPLKEKKFDQEDRIKAEGDALEVKVPAFPWTLGGSARDDFNIRAPFPEDLMGVELSPKQRDRAQELYKQFLRDPQMGMEKSLLDSKDYQNATRAAKREMFMDQLAVYRKMGINTLMVEDSSIGAKVMESQAAKLLPLLQRNDQDQLKNDTQMSIDLFHKMAPEMRENIMKYGTLPGEENQ